VSSTGPKQREEISDYERRDFWTATVSISRLGPWWEEILIRRRYLPFAARAWP